MPLFDPAIFDPAIFDTETSTIESFAYLFEKRKRNTLFNSYCWRHGIWEQTILRENVKQVEKRK
jgi:hypothetical protein